MARKSHAKHNKGDIVAPGYGPKKFKMVALQCWGNCESRSIDSVIWFMSTHGYLPWAGEQIKAAHKGPHVLARWEQNNPEWRIVKDKETGEEKEVGRFHAQPKCSEAPTLLHPHCRPPMGLMAKVKGGLRR